MEVLTHIVVPVDVDKSNTLVDSDQTFNIFDDFHHGLSNLYDTRALWADPRLWWSLLALLIFWLAYVAFFNARLGPASVAATVVSNAAFTERTSRLYARHTPTEQVNRALIATFNNAYRRRYRLSANGYSVLTHLRLNHRFSAELATLLEQLEQKLNVDPGITQRQLVRLYRIL